MGIDDKENPECNDCISERDLLRSISYHESGHTALARITGRHVLQIIDSRLRIVGYEGISIIPHQLAPIFSGKLTSKERIFHLLVGFAIQGILEKNKKNKLGEKMIKGHWDNSSNQPDISKSLKILKKKYIDTAENKQQKIIEDIIGKIQTFLESETKLKEFIARLAYINQRQKLLLPEDINGAEKYAGIDANEKNRLRAGINKLDLLDFSSSSSPLSSEE
ncbi:hypothetical protein KA057_03310 [Candidatus Gracilibacteria bacterium]|nr:hypothetical protein [Candidatus Gracilibacteria bacterium]